MPRDGSGVYSLPAGSTATAGTTITASTHNTPLADLVSDANAARPVVAGGTGATTAANARTNLAVPGLAVNNTMSGDNTFSGANTFTGTTIVPDASADTHALNRQTGDARYVQATNVFTLTSDDTFSGGNSRAVSLTSGKTGARILMVCAADFSNSTSADLQIDINGGNAVTMNNTDGAGNYIETHNSTTGAAIIIWVEVEWGRVVKDALASPRWHAFVSWKMMYEDNTGGARVTSGDLAYQNTSEPSAINFTFLNSGIFINDAGASNRVRVWERG